MGFGLQISSNLGINHSLAMFWELDQPVWLVESGTGHLSSLKLTQNQPDMKLAMNQYNHPKPVSQAHKKNLSEIENFLKILRLKNT